MKKTLFVIITHRQMTEGTKMCAERFQAAGAAMLCAKGYADLACGRSNEITRGMDYMVGKEYGETEGVLVCMDDDMHVTLEQAQEVVDYTRKTGRPASAVYGASDGKLCMHRQSGVEWEVGMGFMAVRLDHLLRVASKYERMTSQYDKGAIPFCQSGPHPSLPTRWTCNDFWFSRELGGVDLLPIAIGHYKQIALYPDEETLRKISAGEKLGDTIPQIHPQPAGWEVANK